MSPGEHEKYAFISYFREDRQRIEPLVNALRKAGIKFWIDETGIQAGNEWKNSINKAIEQSSVFIFCLSKHFTTKAQSYVRDELDLAGHLIDTGQARPGWFLPVCLDGSPIPSLQLSKDTPLDGYQFIHAGPLSKWASKVADHANAIISKPALRRATLVFRNTNVHDESILPVIWPNNVDIRSHNNLENTGSNGAIVPASGRGYVSLESLEKLIFEKSRKQNRSWDSASYDKSNVLTLKPDHSHRIHITPGMVRISIIHMSLSVTHSGHLGTQIREERKESNLVELTLEPRSQTSLTVRKRRRTGLLWLNAETPWEYQLDVV